MKNLEVFHKISGSSVYVMSLNFTFKSMEFLYLHIHISVATRCWAYLPGRTLESQWHSYFCSTLLLYMLLLCRSTWTASTIWSAPFPLPRTKRNAKLPVRSVQKLQGLGCWSNHWALGLDSMRCTSCHWERRAKDAAHATMGLDTRNCHGQLEPTTEHYQVEWSWFGTWIHWILILMYLHLSPLKQLSLRLILFFNFGLCWSCPGWHNCFLVESVYSLQEHVFSWSEIKWNNHE